MEDLEFLQNLLKSKEIKTLEKNKENLMYKKVLKKAYNSHSITLGENKYKLLTYSGIPCIYCESKNKIYYAEKHKLK